MAGKLKVSQEEQAALVQGGNEHNETEQQRKEVQKQRETLIAQCHEVIGRVQANNLMSKFSNVASLVQLHRIKKTKIYRDIPYVGTWDKFCDYLGLSTRKVDEDLLNLSAFGEDFLETCCQLSVGYRELRQLRQLTHDGTLVIDAEAVEIGGERIPLDSDHKDDIQVLLDRILEDKNKQVEAAKAESAAKDRVLEDKQKRIQLLEHKNDALEKADFESTDEAAFIKNLDMQKLLFESKYMAYLDNCAETLRTLAEKSSTGKAPDRMKAALVATAFFIRSRILGLYYDFETEFTGFKNNPEALTDFEAWKDSTEDIDPKYLNTPKA